MDSGLSDREFFRRNLSNVIRLLQMTAKGRTTFYNEKTGSRKEKQAHQLQFEYDLKYTDIPSIHITMNDLIHVKGVLYWIGGIETNPYGRKFREAVLCDAGQEIIPVTIWSENIVNSLEESVWYAFHSVQVKMYKYLRLGITGSSVIMSVTGELPVVPKPDISQFVEDDCERYEVARVIGVTITTNRSCVNRQCNHLYVPEENQEDTECPQCGCFQAVADMKSKNEGTVITILKDTNEKSFWYDVDVFQSHLNVAMSDLKRSIFRMKEFFIRARKDEVIAVGALKPTEIDDGNSE